MVNDQQKTITLIPHIIFFFEFVNYSKFNKLPQYFNLLLTKLNFWFGKYSREEPIQGWKLELVSKELNHLAAILHVYAGGLNFMK